MADILVIKCNIFASNKQLKDIFNYLKTQKEAGVVILPPYLEAQIVPDDIEIKLTGPDDSELIFVDADKII